MTCRWGSRVHQYRRRDKRQFSGREEFPRSRDRLCRREEGPVDCVSFLFDKLSREGFTYQVQHHDYHSPTCCIDISICSEYHDNVPAVDRCGDIIDLIE